MSSACPACDANRVHTPEEWKAYHPYAGHGYLKEHGWSHPVLAEEAAEASLKKHEEHTKP